MALRQRVSRTPEGAPGGTAWFLRQPSQKCVATPLPQGAAGSPDWVLSVRRAGARVHAGPPETRGALAGRGPAMGLRTGSQQAVSGKAGALMTAQNSACLWAWLCAAVTQQAGTGWPKEGRGGTRLFLQLSMSLKLVHKSEERTRMMKCTQPGQVQTMPRGDPHRAQLRDLRCRQVACGMDPSGAASEAAGN